jgi:translation initiation factor 1
MSKKEQKFKGGLAYSTNASLQIDANEHESLGTLENAKQLLRVRIDNKKHAGKIVTLVEKFIGTDDDLNALAKLIKTKCGTGGSVKESVILIQGEVVDKVKVVLAKEGYRVK